MWICQQHVSGDGIMSPQPLYVSYDMTYTYGAEPGTHYRLSNVAETSYRTSTTPTAADRIHSAHHYAYDPNGNLAYVATGRRRSDGSSTPKMSERKLLWDAQNRLRALSDDGYVSLYWYDADGNRTVKEHHGGEAVWVNSAQAGQHTDSVVYSIYPSPYININGDHWTKHYYIGPERVASSTGKLNAGFGSLYYPGNVVASPGPPDNVNYTAMRHVMEDSIASVYERLGVPYEPQRVGIRGEGGHLYIPITLDEENAGDISAETAETPDGSRQRSHPSTLVNGHVYYYHRDHLGSTQAVTDGAGDFTQFVEYTPWGEVFVELKGDSILTTPYLFNGKELDEETGLYYYGARYYDPKMSVWYSTDPMEMDYPWVTTYGYCVGNPVKLWDLLGYEPTDEEAAAIADDVYDPGKKQLPGRWFYIGYNPDTELLRFNEKSTGFKSALYGRYDEKTKDFIEYVYATAGTDPISIKDWENNFQQLFGNSPQYERSVKNATFLSKVFDMMNKELTFVGHSLGGGEASANALATGKSAITFNAAAISPLTKKTLPLNKDAKIKAFIVKGEIVDFLQRTKLGIHAEGIIHYLDAKYLLPVSPGAKYIRTMQRVNNHLMSTVKIKL